MREIKMKIEEQLTFATIKMVETDSHIEHERWLGYIQGLRFVQTLLEGSSLDFYQNEKTIL